MRAQEQCSVRSVVLDADDLGYAVAYWWIVVNDPLLGCGSFVRGRKRKKGDSIPFILSRRDYMSSLHDECP